MLWSEGRCRSLFVAGTLWKCERTRCLSLDLRFRPTQLAKGLSIVVDESGVLLFNFKCLRNQS